MSENTNTTEVAIEEAMEQKIIPMKVNGYYSFIDKESGEEIHYIPLDLKSHLKDSFCAYAKYVLVLRALPDIRDGLKKGQRRIIYAQYDMGNFHNKPPKKSARVVGDVLGKYHPHGDSSVYETLVRMTQPWIMNVPLSIGQGNWGSRDGDNAAAMRYTEVRMSDAANELVNELKLGSVAWNDNYDQSEKEPSILPAKFPNFIINGTEGIAVGMASSMPPHNPIEALECVKLFCQNTINNKEHNVDEFIDVMPAPDFPTGGLIHGLDEYRSAWLNGRGSVHVMASWHSEIIQGRNAIVVTELPYAQSALKAVCQVEAAFKPTEKNNGNVAIEGIRRVVDASSALDGMRIVIILKDGYDPDVVFNELCRLPKSVFNTKVAYNINVVKDDAPKRVGILECFESFVAFREEIITNKTRKLLDDEMKRSHILRGIAAALANIDEVISIIRRNKTQADCRSELGSFLNVDDTQAKAIVEMQLGKLVSSEIDIIKENIAKSEAIVENCNRILSDRIELLKFLIDETDEQIGKFLSYKHHKTGTQLHGVRKCNFEYDLIKISLEDTIPNELCTLIMSNDGFVRRSPVSELSVKGRNTLGSKMMKLAKEDFITLAKDCMSHDYVAIITDKGRVSFCKAYEITSGDTGRHVNNLGKFDDNENISFIMPIKQHYFEEDDRKLVFATQNGYIKQVSLSAFNPNYNKTVIAYKPIENDPVVFADIAAADSLIALISSGNRVNLFNLDDSFAVRSRTAGFVKGMLQIDNAVIVGGAVIEQSKADSSILACMTNTGRMKVSKLSDYRVSNRNTQGVLAMKLQDEKEAIAGGFVCLESQREKLDIMITLKSSITNRIFLGDFRVLSKNSKGISAIRVKEDEIVSVTIAPTTNTSTNSNADALDEIDSPETLVQ
ncbi:DNA gyrase subunit A [Photobacterium damselae]|uniref:DNA gyrase subunit A n=1 Tax=Photobacterium damselae TaxID=38293 RepID=UPI001F354B5F|nr:DNA gyrase subunit A [Photobacterium damselae]UKA04656.1 hypothetical protein IHC89_23850 [Photobacterium damselae subsp. damselae]